MICLTCLRYKNKSFVACMKQTVQHGKISRGQEIHFIVLKGHKSDHLRGLGQKRSRNHLAIQIQAMNTRPSTCADYKPKAVDIYIQCRCAINVCFLRCKWHELLYLVKWKQREKFATRIILFINLHFRWYFPCYLPLRLNKITKRGIPNQEKRKQIPFSTYREQRQNQSRFLA